MPGFFYAQARGAPMATLPVPTHATVPLQGPSWSEPLVVVTLIVAGATFVVAAIPLVIQVWNAVSAKRAAYRQLLVILHLLAESTEALRRVPNLDLEPVQVASEQLIATVLSTDIARVIKKEELLRDVYYASMSALSNLAVCDLCQQDIEKYASDIKRAQDRTNSQVEVSRLENEIQKELDRIVEESQTTLRQLQSAVDSLRKELGNLF